jgi:hypothetical protein
MKKIFSILILCLLLNQSANAQGCVAIRGAGGATCNMMDHMKNIDTSKWLFSANTRYFKSFRHFVGKIEQPQRQELGTEVINHTFSMDYGLTRILNKTWSVALYVPIIANTRSSLYEHGGVTRHETHSFGLGDIRVAGYAWLLDPAKHMDFNIQAGLGIKFATGDYKYQDRFYTAAGTTIMGPVDQSIQLGDGGTGFTTELNAYYAISHQLNLYGNFYYLLSPREQNGVSTQRGGTPSATTIAYTTDVMSVPDQYLLRAGANYMSNKFTFSGGVRYECIPVNDLIGGSTGFRRPGKVVTVEPGITYTIKKCNIYAYVPIAVVRNRTQSIPDKIKTDLTGVYAQGDAAFADYSVNVGFSIRF